MRHVTLLILTVALLTVLVATADDTRRRGRLRPIPEALNPALLTSTPPLVYDTVREAPDTLVSLSGYDKPLRTSRETFLVTNRSDRTLHGMALTITYLSTDGRQLHERTDTIGVSVPAGETRMARISTWDTQHSYYYVLGQQPRTANVTPYTVTSRIHFLLY